jgi:hypothetical protein
MKNGSVITDAFHAAFCLMRSMGIAPNFSPPQTIPILDVCGNPHVRRIYAEGTAISNSIKKDKRFMV